MKKFMMYLLLVVSMFVLSACGTSQSKNNNLSSENVSTRSDETQSLSNPDEQTSSQSTSSVKEIESTEKSEISQTDDNNSAQSSKPISSSQNEPDEIELMTYSQTVLKDYFENCKYSRNKADYKFVKTNLRYKIEGTVSTTENSQAENFYMIIEFTNENYDTYDLLSLQIGDNLVYESSNYSDLPTPTETNGNEILNEANTQMYNEVMEILYSDYDRSEDEILEEIAPNYDMTASELKNFLNEYMEAYYSN